MDALIEPSENGSHLDNGYAEYKKKIQDSFHRFGVKGDATDFEVKLCQLAHAHSKNRDSIYHRIDHNIRDARYSDMIMEKEYLESYRSSAYIFAYLHDIGRYSDGWEPEHGRISAKIAGPIINQFWPSADLASIVWAIEHHSHIKESNGKFLITPPEGVDQDIFNIGSDADQLDLYRVEKFRREPGLNTKYLHTRFAKDFANSEKHKSIYLP